MVCRTTVVPRDKDSLPTDSVQFALTETRSSILNTTEASGVIYVLAALAVLKAQQRANRYIPILTGLTYRGTGSDSGPFTIACNSITGQDAE